MNQKYKILSVILIIAIGLGGYYGYEQYNLSKTQEYLQISLTHKIAASNYSNQASVYENKNDYANAAIMFQKSSDEISKALKSDSDALTHASGVYTEYINSDILVLQTTSKLLDFQIYLNKVKNNDLNQGQEKVDPVDLYPHINQLKEDISVYKNNENKIISANPEKFKFLNSSS
ncbi:MULTISPECIES: hypothetical protein [Methanobacterium]|uniref:Uncharacterized protein n=1 Tax=Methanobacterium bryantii TaxID=2161 RepID=A0A2A2H9N7_METBR|nr:MULTISPECIES: hypothetical protein [Methanobacterium]OEC86920.1 hypothetical protein A9507_08375 [Methanobacterium sp. A39]PAV05980.1 hypothetical protein ASJ80_14115 [Methanobacterium bryantii]